MEEKDALGDMYSTQNATDKMDEEGDEYAWTELVMILLMNIYYLLFDFVILYIILYYIFILLF